MRRWLSDDPPFVEAALNDRHFNLLDRNRIRVDRKHAGGLAWRRADTTGELGEVVCQVERFKCLTPLPAVDKVVPLGDQIAKRATLVAERHSAVHASSTLVAELVLRLKVEVLAVILDPLCGIASYETFTIDAQKSADLTHPASPPHCECQPALQHAPREPACSRVA